ncbi:sodium-dependent transporter [Corynebacterium sp. 3HC-13]|uniref:sodium-dependent transporter n=1 Tax=Corynebacterium poyangense TaxID=2684405 RepID=UPI001CD01FDF|nr:sodium-dependent transporter [Corynebacterium poyangense]MBZ8178334.1 sodium-dependent transporter [Corynebacterium poyangense]
MTSTNQKPGREVFSSRAAFLFAAIGSAVGLGNIWRFPYVAYDSGGGAFLIPYIVALLTAGIPLLFFDYAIGHRFRGSAPKSFHRLRSWAEPVGWIQTGVSFFITLYYSVIVGWALIYAFKSLTQPWGGDADSYFFKDFLRMETSHLLTFDFVWPIAIALLAVWIMVILVLAAGVDRGIGIVSKIFIPLLAILFIIVVLFSLTLEGAATGLNALFTPNWSALKNPTVWLAAYGQIFFSLSVAFGIMLTYASYLKPRSNLTGTGLVTAFANSSFEVLAGVGVFSTLGFMAVKSGVPVEDVATSGIGLAFVAFPTVISQMGGLLGGIFGFLFFLSLFIAGITSLMSLFEVVVGAAQDKFNLERKTAVIGIGAVMTVLSLLLFPTTSGLVALDIMDKFTNSIGIVSVAIIAIVVVDWLLHRSDELALHLNAVSSFRVGTIWRICVSNLTPVVLFVMLFQEIISLIKEPYGGYQSGQVALFGWAVLAIIFIGAMVMTIVPWRGEQFLAGPPGSDFGVRTARQLEARTPRQAVSIETPTQQEEQS